MNTLTLKSTELSIPYFYRTILVHCAFGLFKVFFVLFGGTALFFEEAQYWLWSKHLDLSYYSKPPLIAWVNYLSTGILGDTELAVRINAILFGIFTGVVIYFMALRILHDEKKAFWSSVLLLAFPYFWIVTYFFTTDSLVTFFWVWAVYAFYMAVHGRPLFWIWLGIAVGLGFLSKYVMLFFWPMALLYLIVYRRKEFNRPYIYLSVLLSLVFLIPVVYWNYLHDWVSVKHVWTLASGHENEAAFSLVRSLKQFGEYIGGQLGFWMLFFIVPVFRSIKRLISGRENIAGIVLMFPVISVFLFFAALSFGTSVEVNWTFFVLPMLAIYAVRESKHENIPYRGQLFASATLMVIFFSIPMVSKISDFPASFNPEKRLMGWESMAADLTEIIESYDDPNLVLVADSYKTASMLTFYLPGNPPVYNFSPKERMNQFDLWEHHNGYTDAPATTVFVGEKLPDPCYESEAFGTSLYRHEILRLLNKTDAQVMYVQVYDNYFGLEGHKKEAY